MEQLILDILEQSLSVKQQFIRQNTALIQSGAELLTEAFQGGKKLLIFGNGGSAADAQHIAAEFVNRFQMERRPLPAIALTTDTSVITSIANDYSFDAVFLKQVQALGTPGDVVMAISTSGNSPNVIQAVREARSMGLKVMGLSGIRGELKTLCDIAFCIDSPVTARIQETHIFISHILCDLAERMLFND